jgi:hypothetical protein
MARHILILDYLHAYNDQRMLLQAEALAPTQVHLSLVLQHDRFLGILLASHMVVTTAIVPNMTRVGRTHATERRCLKSCVWQKLHGFIRSRASQELVAQ